MSERACVRVYVCVCACARACVRARARACVCVCADGRASARPCLCVVLHASQNSSKENFLFGQADGQAVCGYVSRAYSVLRRDLLEGHPKVRQEER